MCIELQKNRTMQKVKRKKIGPLVELSEREIDLYDDVSDMLFASHAIQNIQFNLFA